MAEPVARIRPFQASDDKVVRFAIGKAHMESLAVANRRGEFVLLLSSTSEYMLNTYFYHRLRSPVHDYYLPCVILHFRTLYEYVADRCLWLPGLSTTLPSHGCNSCSNHGFH